MEDLNFIVPAARPSLDTKVALKYFKASGSAMSVEAGKTLFAENEKGNPLFLQRDKMYFLVEGEVDLTVNQAPVGAVRSGEIFGEMTLITRMPRTATATAKTDCRLYTLDGDQLHAALSTAPEFGLLLMSIMIARLRDSIAALEASGALRGGEELKDSEVFDKKLPENLVDELGDSARMRFAANKVIVEEGQTGVLMYVVLEGHVEIAVHGKVVGTIGPGGMFGEMALIARTARVASAIAKTDCELLAIGRNVFLDLVAANPKFAVSLLGAVGNRARFMASLRR
ncbi:MAG: cyclic nucleotide-binding domain-containing protein [Nitrosomonadales bacterium]|nr:cyclic nucleotide-binding domain-containing protein [Nitrosomonadales bacterium]